MRFASQVFAFYLHLLVGAADEVILQVEDLELWFRTDYGNPKAMLDEPCIRELVRICEATGISSTPTISSPVEIMPTSGFERTSHVLMPRLAKVPT